jgi:hypothetical protein
LSLYLPTNICKQTRMQQMEVQQLLKQLFSLEFFSELHPLFVHFPVGLLLLAVVFNFLPNSINSKYQAAIQILLRIGSFFSLLSCISGYILAQSQTYHATLINSHQWFGIATFFIFLIPIFYPNRQKIMLGIGGASLLFTLYFGTVLSHGSFLKWKEKVVKQLLEIMPTPTETSVNISPKKTLPPPSKPILQDTQVSFAALPEQTIKDLKSQGISVQVVDPTTQQLSINFVNVKKIEANMFERLFPFKDQIAAFRITNVMLSPEIVQNLLHFKNVSILQLPNTQVTNELVNLLSQLPKLQQLNLYNNPVSDQVIPLLKKMTSLQKLYVWQTNISQQALDDLQKSNPRLYIEGGNQSFVKPDSLKK